MARTRAAGLGMSAKRMGGSCRVSGLTRCPPDWLVAARAVSQQIAVEGPQPV